MVKLTPSSLYNLAIRNCMRSEIIKNGNKSYVDIEDGYLIAYFNEFDACTRIESYGFNGFINPSPSMDITIDDEQIITLKSGLTKFVLGDRNVEE